jgi:hypothetical protein
MPFLSSQKTDGFTNAEIRCWQTGTVYDSGICLLMSGTEFPFLPWSNVRSSPAMVMLTRAESKMTLDRTKSSKPVPSCESELAFLCLIPQGTKIVQRSLVCSCELSPNAYNVPRQRRKTVQKTVKTVKTQQEVCRCKKSDYNKDLQFWTSQRRLRRLIRKATAGACCDVTAHNSREHTHYKVTSARVGRAGERRTDNACCCASVSACGCLCRYIPLCLGKGGKRWLKGIGFDRGLTGVEGLTGVGVNSLPVSE